MFRVDFQYRRASVVFQLLTCFQPLCLLRYKFPCTMWGGLWALQQTFCIWVIRLCQTGLIIAHLRTKHFPDMLVVDLSRCRLAEVVKVVKVHGIRMMKTLEKRLCKRMRTKLMKWREMSKRYAHGMRKTWRMNMHAKHLYPWDIIRGHHHHTTKTHDVRCGVRTPPVSYSGSHRLETKSNCDQVVFLRWSLHQTICQTVLSWNVCKIMNIPWTSFLSQHGYHVDCLLFAQVSDLFWLLLRDSLRQSSWENGRNFTRYVHP